MQVIDSVNHGPILLGKSPVISMKNGVSNIASTVIEFAAFLLNICRFGV
jgi:hypothetical protein